MLSTLGYFGLPSGYMDGKGHFPNWEKEMQKKKKMKNPKKQKPNAALQKLKRR